MSHKIRGYLIISFYLIHLCRSEEVKREVSSAEGYPDGKPPTSYLPPSDKKILGIPSSNGETSAGIPSIFLPERVGVGKELVSNLGSAGLPDSRAIYPSNIQGIPSSSYGVPSQSIPVGISGGAPSLGYAVPSLQIPGTLSGIGLGIPSFKRPYQQIPGGIYRGSPSITYGVPSQPSPQITGGTLSLPSTIYGVPSQQIPGAIYRGSPSVTYGVPSQPAGLLSAGGVLGVPSTQISGGTLSLPSTSYGVPSQQIPGIIPRRLSGTPSSIYTPSSQLSRLMAAAIPGLGLGIPSYPTSLEVPPQLTYGTPLQNSILSTGSRNTAFQSSTGYPLSSLPTPSYPIPSYYAGVQCSREPSGFLNYGMLAPNNYNYEGRSLPGTIGGDILGAPVVTCGQAGVCSQFGTPSLSSGQYFGLGGDTSRIMSGAPGVFYSTPQRSIHGLLPSSGVGRLLQPLGGGTTSEAISGLRLGGQLYGPDGSYIY